MARFRTRGAFGEGRAAAKRMTRQAAVPVWARGGNIASASNNGVWHHTWGDNSGAKSANTRMIASGRGDMGRPPWSA
jgi:hypothetical protein